MKFSLFLIIAAALFSGSFTATAGNDQAKKLRELDRMRNEAASPRVLHSATSLGDRKTQAGHCEAMKHGKPCPHTPQCPKS